MARYALMVAVVLVAVGCSRTSEPKRKVAAVVPTPVVFNTANAPVVEFNAPDMMCPEGCGVKVKEILSGQPGAKEVVVDFDAKVAKVAIDKDAKFDTNAAVAALVDHGFKNSSLKTAAAADTKAPAPADKAKENGAG